MSFFKMIADRWRREDAAELEDAVHPLDVIEQATAAPGEYRNLPPRDARGRFCRGECECR